MLRAEVAALALISGVPGAVAGWSGVTMVLAMIVFVPAVLLTLVIAAAVGMWVAVRRQRNGSGALAFALMFALMHWPFTGGLVPTLLGHASPPAYGRWVMTVCCLSAMAVSPLVIAALGALRSMPRG
jgi:hypothetical protein